MCYCLNGLEIFIRYLLPTFTSFFLSLVLYVCFIQLSLASPLLGDLGPKTLPKIDIIILAKKFGELLSITRIHFPQKTSSAYYLSTYLCTSSTSAIFCICHSLTDHRFCSKPNIVIYWKVWQSHRAACPESLKLAFNYTKTFRSKLRNICISYFSMHDFISLLESTLKSWPSSGTHPSNLKSNMVKTHEPRS